MPSVCLLQSQLLNESFAQLRNICFVPDYFSQSVPFCVFLSCAFCLHVHWPQVQENVIDLVGRIADRGHEYVPAREWMRICFELLDMLKAHKKAIRRATVNTFGYIAKAIGPQARMGRLTGG